MDDQTQTPQAQTPQAQTLNAEQGSSAPTPTVAAWDLPTRLFHWLLTAMIISAVLTRKFGDLELFWHKLNGYGVLILILYRLLWGLVGGSTARFSAFLTWPWQAARYGMDLLRGRSKRHLGHNPLGGWMVMALLAALLFQTATGLFSNDDALAEGPLAHLLSYDRSAFLTGLHFTSFRILIALIGVHIAVNLLYFFWKKEDLITPMVSGRKPRAPYLDQAEARFGSLWRAFSCLCLSAATVLGAIKIIGGSLF